MLLADSALTCAAGLAPAPRRYHWDMAAKWEKFYRDQEAAK